MGSTYREMVNAFMNGFYVQRDGQCIHEWVLRAEMVNKFMNGLYVQRDGQYIYEWALRTERWSIHV